MSRPSWLFIILTVLALTALGFGTVATLRVSRVRKAAEAVPIHPGAQEGARQVRYFPRVFAWDDRSSARVQRIFAMPESVSLGAVARHAHLTLAADGWYLVDPADLNGMEEPQVIFWQRDPDERLDLVRLWPLANVTREQRLHGGMFPVAFLDMPVVFQWDWALGGPRAQRPRPSSPHRLVTPAP